jgi:hypothetical protein
VVREADLYGRSLGFFRAKPLLFSFKQLFNCNHEAEWTPFQTQYSENIIALEIEPGTAGSVARNSDY